MDDDTDYFESSTTERVVVHLECNDFYASVERKLHGIGESVPIALVQDKTVRMFDFAAQQAGVNRQMSEAEAKRVCPQLKTLELPMLEVDRSNLRASNGVSSKDYVKADLGKYRKEGEKVFNVVKRFMQKNDVFQRSGIEEAYMQLHGHVTEFTNTQFQNVVRLVKTHTDTDIRGDVTSFLLQDFILMRAALISFRIRRAVKEELGYTLSAGIAGSPHVARLATRLNRPSGQCIVCLDAARRFLGSYDVADIPVFGAKYTSRLAGILGPNPVVKALQALDVDRLSKALGGEEEARHVLQIANGLASGSLKPKEHNTSITSLKVFSTVTHDMDFLKAWLKLLCTELIHRMVEDFESTQSKPLPLVKKESLPLPLGKPTSLTVSLWAIPKKEYPKSVKLGGIDSIYTSAVGLLEDLAVHLPATKLSVVVGDFQSMPLKTLIGFYPISSLYDKLPSEGDVRTLIKIRVVSPIGHKLEYSDIDPEREYLHAFKIRICKTLELKDWAAFYLSLFTSDQGVFQLTGNNRTLSVNGITKHCKLFLEFKEFDGAPSST